MACEGRAGDPDAPLRESVDSSRLAALPHGSPRVTLSVAVAEMLTLLNVSHAE